MPAINVRIHAVSMGPNCGDSTRMKIKDPPHSADKMISLSVFLMSIVVPLISIVISSVRHLHYHMNEKVDSGFR